MNSAWLKQVTEAPRKCRFNNHKISLKRFYLALTRKHIVQLGTAHKTDNNAKKVCVNDQRS